MAELFDNEKPEPEVLIENRRPRSFHRQLVLIEAVARLQLDCKHELTTPTKDTIICAECGALWIK